jgi:hypothetical protein
VAGLFFALTKWPGERSADSEWFQSRLCRRGEDDRRHTGQAEFAYLSTTMVCQEGSATGVEVAKMDFCPPRHCGMNDALRCGKTVTVSPPCPMNMVPFVLQNAPG